MSIDSRLITFYLFSEKLIEEVKSSISYRRKGESYLFVDLAENMFSGEYYTSEFDEYGDDWAPSEIVPNGKSIIKWVFDILTHNGLVSYEEAEKIGENIDALEGSLVKYDIMNYKCSPQGENYVYYQQFDGHQIKVLSMSENIWDSMWYSSNKDRAEEIFNKYGLNMEEYSRNRCFIGDTFDYLKDEDVFIELIEEFGHTSIINK